MTSNAALKEEPAPIKACTVSRDVQNFDLLIDDMETELGESWGNLSFADARVFLDQPDAKQLEFIAVAIDDEDEEQIAEIGELIKKAARNEINVILVAEEVSPRALHQLLRLGAADFIPYPLPEGELHEAIERIRAPKPQPHQIQQEQKSSLRATHNHDGIVLPVHGLAGGAGATTLAMNLAWELANVDKKNPPRVCVLDLDFQFGSVATYLDLPRRDRVYELLSDIPATDSESFMQALVTYNDKLHVLTAPSDILPLDLVTPEEIEKLIETAKSNFDYVVIDMPTTVIPWTENVIHMAHVYMTTMELDMRSAQNALRLIRAFKAEELPTDKLRFILNRAPKFTDLSSKSRVKRLAESLDIRIELQLPDGGKQVAQACDHGQPLAENAPKNPLRKEIQKLAASVHEGNQAAVAAQ